jgi:hypothetical protein
LLHHDRKRGQTPLPQTTSHQHHKRRSPRPERHNHLSGDARRGADATVPWSVFADAVAVSQRGIREGPARASPHRPFKRKAY